METHFVNIKKKKKALYNKKSEFSPKSESTFLCYKQLNRI